MKRIIAGLTAAILVLGSAMTADAVVGYRLLTFGNTAVRWHADIVRSQETRITYALLESSETFANTINCRSMRAASLIHEAPHIGIAQFETELAEAFAMWQAVANLRFERVSDWRTANIVIGAQAQSAGTAFADVLPARTGSGVAPIERALICLDPTSRWKIGFDGNLKSFDLRYVFAHEIGHAIGLDHPSRVGQVMSFNYGEHFRSLQTGDIAGVQAVYGVRR